MKKLGFNIFIFFICFLTNNIISQSTSKTRTKVYLKYSPKKIIITEESKNDSNFISNPNKIILGHYYPNQYFDSMEWDIYLPKADSLKITIYDSEIKLIDTAYNDYLEEGFYKLIPDFYFDKFYKLYFQLEMKDTVISKKMMAIN